MSEIIYLKTISLVLTGFLRIQRMNEVRLILEALHSKQHEGEEGYLPNRIPYISTYSLRFNKSISYPKTRCPEWKHSKEEFYMTHWRMIFNHGLFVSQNLLVCKFRRQFTFTRENSAARTVSPRKLVRFASISESQSLAVAIVSKMSNISIKLYTIVKD